MPRKPDIYQNNTQAMKNTILIPFILISFLFSSLALRGMDVGVHHVVYGTPQQSYVEVSIEIAGASVNYVHIDSTKLQAKVAVTILILNGEEVVNYEKYILNSPEVVFPESLLDLKRLMVNKGEYTLDVSCVDVNDSTNVFQHKSPLTVDLGESVYLTEINLLRTFRKAEAQGPFVKNGLYMEPLPFNYYDRSLRQMAFYAEVYHTNQVIKEDSYTIRYILEEEKGNNNRTLITAGVQRKPPSPIDAVLVPVDISELPSGNYTLTVELRTKVNELLQTRKVQFQRSNPYLKIQDAGLTEELVSEQFVQKLNEEELRYALRAISPLTRGTDNETLKNVLLKDAEIKDMRYFLFRHFAKRDPNNPDLAYQEYIKLAKQVDEKFHSGFRHGFETDRGRMYLRYGSPDDIIRVEDEPSAPPYEIWVYYNFPKTQQQNVKFLFYNPTLAGEDFIVLHSTARGEINNPNWERDLYSRNAGEQFDGDNYHDATRMQPNTNRNARIYFEDF